jgi:hypothetical protein
MKTERDIIYSIWDVVRGAETNNDDPINERLMRGFLRSHRGKSLAVAYKLGSYVPDEVFQDLGVIEFDIKSDGDYKSKLPIPKTIRFDKGNNGIMLNKGAYTVPTLNSEEYDLMKNNKFNCYKPRVKYLNNHFTLNIGAEILCAQTSDISSSVLNTAVLELAQEAVAKTVNITGLGVLVNPDDEVGYDWLTSPYPMPDELIEGLINSVNAREFNIFLKVKSDETGDLRNNLAESNTREEL